MSDESDTADQLVRDMVRNGPPVSQLDDTCGYCEVPNVWPPSQHRVNCLYRRAWTLYPGELRNLR